jgi:hypothetical protein
MFRYCGPDGDSSMHSFLSVSLKANSVDYPFYIVNVSLLVIQRFLMLMFTEQRLLPQQDVFLRQMYGYL